MSIRLGALVAHARSVRSEDRPAFAAWLRRSGAPGALLLETCHRVELVGPDATIRALRGGSTAGVSKLDHDASVRHVVRLAVGLESAVVGEDQILHQLRAAIRDARTARGLDPGLDHLVDLALRAGRRARTWLPARRPTLADAALDAAVGVGAADGTVVLVVGGGSMGRLAAATARGRGCRVLVASRTHARAERVAASVGAEPVAFDPGVDVARFDGVVVALAGPWPLSAATADALAGSSMRVADLSAPPAVAPALAARLGPRLTSIDDLAVGAGPAEGPLRQRLERLVEETVAAFDAWVDAEADRSLARALAERASDATTAELDALWARIPELDGTVRAEIERMASQLTTRLLRDPLERLGEDADGRHGRAAQELFRL